ncbi:7955_t:CDS:2, partial [Funneliformis geosporum]
ELDCQDNQLTNLSLINCFQIKRFYCSHNKLKTLDLNNCTSLQKLRCSHNFLVKIKLPNAVREKLEVLNLRDNDFSEQDLSFLSYLVNLNELYLGNSDQERIEGNVYNRFYGSLESLKDLNKLESLDISNTDIDSEAKCQIFAELLVNSEGEMEISRSVENFSQKLQEYKKMLQNNNLQRTSDFFEKLKNSPSKQKKVNKAKVSNQFENMTVLELSMQKRTKKDQREELFNEEILETESDEQEHWQNVLQSIKNKLQSQGAKLEIVEELCQIQDEISRLKKKEELEVEKFRQALQVEPTSSKLN